VYVKYHIACFEKENLTFAAYDSISAGRIVYMKYAAIEVG
jgi:hypothetical protein